MLKVPELLLPVPTVWLVGVVTAEVPIGLVVVQVNGIVQVLAPEEIAHDGYE